MRMMGIDPGYDRLGLAVVEKSAHGKDRLLHSSCLQTSAKSDIHDRLLSVGLEAARIMDDFKPDCAAMEALFVTRNQKTAMRVAEARGIIAYEASRRLIPMREYSPVQIKSAVTGNGRSDKAMMAKMVSLLLGWRQPNKDMLDDEYDAIAAALAGIAMSGKS